MGEKYQATEYDENALWRTDLTKRKLQQGSTVSPPLLVRSSAHSYTTHTCFVAMAFCSSGIVANSMRPEAKPDCGSKLQTP